MRRLVLSFLILGLLLVPRAPVHADDVQAVIDKAIKAHGGAQKLDRIKSVQAKTKGTIDAAGGITFTQEVQVQLPDKVRSVMNLEVGGQKVNLITVYDGKNAWMNVNGTNMDVPDKLLEEIKDQMYAGVVARLTVLKEKPFELSPLGDAKVDGKDAVGVRVASKGHKDISLFFDKQTGLLVKSERRAVDPMSGQEFTEETVMSDFHEVEGTQSAKKTVMYRDGKKFMEAEEVEWKLVDKFDDSTFAKP
jgi:hypothetical protein